MKKLYLIFMIPIVFLLTACFADPVQDDLVNYSNEEMKKAAELERKAISAYDSVSGVNYTSDQTMYDAMLGTVIPTYNEFIKELDNVNIETEELRKIHETYIKAADLQYNAFVKIVHALEAQDLALVQEANTNLEQARQLIREYQADLKALAKEHDVKWEGTNTEL